MHNSNYLQLLLLVTNIENSWNRCRSKLMNYSKPPLYTLHPHSLCYAYRVGVNERSYICWIENIDIYIGVEEGLFFSYRKQNALLPYVYYYTIPPTNKFNNFCVLLNLNDSWIQNAFNIYNCNSFRFLYY